MTEEQYEHRGEDKHGNPDDNFTEKEALALAKEQGITFIDEFKIEGKDEVYKTRKQAEKAAKEGDVIIQTRRQA